MLSYVTRIRRELHQYPEIGFDLPRTLSLVRRELEAFGIPYTEEYGKSGIVATINEEKSHFTIGIRADMDALPVTERTSVPYRSKNKGQMHACGHDGHTAILLDTARQLAERKDEIRCRVKLIFQPAEEYAPSGASLMAEDGVMDGIDCALALHCDPKYDAGSIYITPGPQNAMSNGFLLEFFGKSAHVAYQQAGIDAIAMAVKAYVGMELAIAKEVAAKETCVFNVGAIQGGQANNVICDHASMYCTLRTWEEAVNDRMIGRIRGICQGVAKESGGKFKFTQKKIYPILVNDTKITDLLWECAAKVVGPEKMGKNDRIMGGEDFSFFARQKPSAMFRLGIRNPEKDCIYSLHQDKFNMDEDALSIGSAVFMQFITDHMDGIPL